MASDAFSLEDALQVTARRLACDQEYLMADAEYRVPWIWDALATRLQPTHWFYGGSLARGTWGSPHYEYDLFVVLDDVDRHYLGSSPGVIFQDIAGMLRGSFCFRREAGSGRIQIANGDWQGNGPDRTARIVILPAFAADRGLMIPDRWRDAWICVDPSRLDRLAKAADKRQSNWRQLTRIAKTWNNRDEKFLPYIKPGLLLEVMAMDIVQAGFGHDLGTQIVALFQMLYKRFEEEWPDPAGLGPPLTSYMTPGRRAYARDHLKHAWLTLAEAKRADNSGNCADAKHLARMILGKMLPLAPPEDH